jgi:hypothetical protein
LELHRAQLCPRLRVRGVHQKRKLKLPLGLLEPLLPPDAAPQGGARVGTC